MGAPFYEMVHVAATDRSGEAIEAQSIIDWLQGSADYRYRNQHTVDVPIEFQDRAAAEAAYIHGRIDAFNDIADMLEAPPEVVIQGVTDER